VRAIGTVWILVMLGACADAVTWAHGREPSRATFDAAGNSYRGWLKTRIYGHGHGYGHGYGDGYGYGYGSGNGSGHGSGNGSGHGSGNGSGHGSGNGSGYGSGNGYGDGDDFVSITHHGETWTGDIEAQLFQTVAEVIG
jgi:hypothetical protein